MPDLWGSEHRSTPQVSNARVELKLSWLFGFLGTEIERERLKSI